MNNTIKEILYEEGYDSTDSLLKDISLLFALSKKEQYKAECEFFERKYGMTLKKFEKTIHTKKGMEDFQKEEDFEDWEFAHNAVRWWGKKSRELHFDKIT